VVYLIIIAIMKVEKLIVFMLFYSL